MAMLHRMILITLVGELLSSLLSTWRRRGRLNISATANSCVVPADCMLALALTLQNIALRLTTRFYIKVLASV